MTKYLTLPEALEKAKEIHARLKAEIDEMFVQDKGDSSPIETRTINVTYRNIGEGKPSYYPDDNFDERILRHVNPDCPRPDSDCD